MSLKPDLKLVKFDDSKLVNFNDSKLSDVLDEVSDKMVLSHIDEQIKLREMSIEKRMKELLK